MELFFIWLSVVVVFFLIEMMGVSYFFFFSFSLGALCAALLSLYIPNIFFQALTFLGASALFFVLLRVVFHPAKYNKGLATNIDRIVGMRGIVIKSIAPGITGQVKVDGVIWSAHAITSEIIVEGVQVEIVRVQGAHVIVKLITAINTNIKE